MKAHHFLVQGYGLLLRCYPRRFQAEYAEELVSVFAQTAQEAARHGWWVLASVCWREVRDWPGAVLLEHWRAFSQREGIMPTDLSFHIFEAHDDGQPGTGREALWAALPFLMVSVLYGIVPLFGQLGEIASIGFLLALGAVALGGLGYAWFRRWPRWSAGWAFFGVWLLLGGLGLLTSMLSGNDNTQQLILLVALAVVGALILPLALYVVARQDRLRGVLLALPFMLIIWLPVLEFVPNEIRNPLQAVVWLLAALVAGGLIKQGSVRVGVLAVLALNLFTSAAYAYARTFYHNYPSFAASTEPVWMEYLYNFLPLLAALSTLVVGPVALRGLNQLGRVSEGGGRLGNMLAVAGLLFSVAGNLGCLVFFTSSELQAVISTSWVSQSLISAAYLGGALFIAGVVMVVVFATRHKALPHAALSSLLVLVLVGLPFMVMLPFWLNFRVLPTQVPFGFLQLYEHKLASYVVAGVWLMAGCGLAFYLTRRPVQSAVN